MTTTEPITGRRLGRRAPSNRPALHLASLIKAVPDHPLTVDHLAAVANWRMLAGAR